MTYVRNSWYVAAWSHDIAVAKPHAMQILGDRLVIYRSEAGKLAVLEDRCVHRLAPLSLGRCEGERLRCMYHGLLFDPDGRVVEIPGQDMIPDQARVRAYPAVERHNWVWVWMGTPDRADETLIPAAVGLDHPDYLLAHGQLDYAAEAQLINDNLLDFSHLSFVHADSFKLGPEPAATQASITPIEHGIRYRRWIEALSSNGAGMPDVPADAYMAYDFLIPGVLLMAISSWPLGTAKRLDHGHPADLSEAVRDVAFTSQAVTPMGDKSARYFFSIGPHRAFGDDAMRDAMMAMVRKAFEEDRRMIEAQQRVIEATPQIRIMPTAHDRTLTMFKAKVERLARADARTASV